MSRGRFFPRLWSSADQLRGGTVSRSPCPPHAGNRYCLVMKQVLSDLLPQLALVQKGPSAWPLVVETYLMPLHLLLNICSLLYDLECSYMTSCSLCLCLRSPRVYFDLTSYSHSTIRSLHRDWKVRANVIVMSIYARSNSWSCTGRAHKCNSCSYGCTIPNLECCKDRPSFRTFHTPMIYCCSSSVFSPFRLPRYVGWFSHARWGFRCSDMQVTPKAYSVSPGTLVNPSSCC